MLCPLDIEICRGRGAAQTIRMVAAQKLLGSGAPKLSPYYSTDWLGDDTERKPLPTAITLETFYTAMPEPLTPVTSRAGESLPDVAARLEMVRKLEREVVTLERRLRTEPQVNRKIEINRTLKMKLAALEATR
jgi:hypothetical protein